jgi:spermidine dehydrogenase
LKLQQKAAVKNKGLDSDTHDQEIGMGKPIERRDFLQGAAFSLATAIGGLLPGQVFGAGLDAGQVGKSAAQDHPDYYPPTRTGMRGSHPGSFENAHAVRDNPGLLTEAEDTGEHFDLIA